VHAFLKTAPVAPAGHNVAIYHSPSAEGVEIEVGVQVSGPFEGTPEIWCSSTPAGRAQGITAQCEPGWEVYGDWKDDPAQLRTDVFRLLTPAA
jgi:hypothetical protein